MNQQRLNQSQILDQTLLKKNNDQKKKPKTADYLRLLKYTTQFKYLLILGNISLIITSLSSTLLPLISGQVIDKIYNKKQFLIYCFYMVIISVVSAFFGFCRGYCFNLLGQNIMRRLRNDLFQRLVQKDIHFYDINKSGQLISRLTSDITVVQSAASDNISMLLRNLLQFFVSLFFLFFISWKLTLVILAIIPPITLVVRAFMILFKKYKKKYQDQLAKANSIANQVFGNIRIVRAFAKQGNEKIHYENQINSVFKVGKTQALIYAIFVALLTIFVNCIILVVLIYGGKLVRDSQISIGKMISYTLYSISMTVSLNSISSVVSTIISAAAVCQKIFEIMDQKITIINGTVDPMRIINFQNLFEFKKVSFAYQSKKDVNVLSNFNLVIRKGESVGIVGISGSGKSTIVSLMERFYDVGEGEILFKGIPLTEIDQNCLRKNIGYVSQQPTLFSGTVKYNILYGTHQNISQDLIHKCVKMSYADEFLYVPQTFPDGLETVVGQRGVQLSGGQKQRIAIARAFIKNPEILIFDQATSSLDAHSEEKVQQTIEKVLQQKQNTVIIIAHRLSTIRKCERIIVMSQGRIKEEGSHEDLYQLDGIYKKLVQKQVLK